MLERKTRDESPLTFAARSHTTRSVIRIDNTNTALSIIPTFVPMHIFWILQQEMPLRAEIICPV